MSGMSPILILGAGSYGTALAVILSRKSYEVFLWGHNSSHVRRLREDRCNKVYLPNVFFPPSLNVIDALSMALPMCRDIFIAVPSHVFSDVLIRVKPYLRFDTRVILATKGLEENTGRFLQDVMYDILGRNIPCAVISGPTFANELAVGLPTAITLVATGCEFLSDLKLLLHCSRNFRVYCHSDFVGIQLAGVVKNIIAIAVGVSDGIGFGSGARAMLITRGLAEMTRLGAVMGANFDIFVNMAGLGDLVLTCTDNQSRNRKFGILLGQGSSVLEAKKQIGQVVEGMRNVKEVCLLSAKHNVDMPITEQVYCVLYKNKSVHNAVMSLLDRE